MKISEIGEFGLIERIRRRFGAKSAGEIVQGIGDDAAVIRRDQRSEMRDQSRYFLLTTDTLVENVHFNLKYASLFDVGWKLIAANMSDIAAMGGRPKYALITIGLRNEIKVKDIDEFYRGVRALAKRFQVSIVGGDIVASPKSLFFTMDLYGEAKKVITRSGAKHGDCIYYLGPLGESALGLNILKGKKKTAGLRRYIKAHLDPMPLVSEGLKISKYANSMIDNSDGLARCLIEICKASKVGAQVRVADIVPSHVKRAAKALKLDPLKLVLHGGEDYGLLFTSKNKDIKLKGARLIGRIIKKRKIYLIDPAGRKKELFDKGFEHF